MCDTYLERKKHTVFNPTLMDKFSMWKEKVWINVEHVSIKHGWNTCANMLDTFLYVTFTTSVS